VTPLKKTEVVSRRSVLRGMTGVGLGAVAASTTGLAGRAVAGPGSPSVAVFGAGVAGLTAAHELAERGVAVTVYERKALGGKARSIPVPDSAGGGRPELPGEHGFRFFPGFYHDVTDTMRRVPFPGNENGSWDNLTKATSYLGARSGGRADLTLPFVLPPPPTPSPLTPTSALATVRAGLETGSRIPPNELAFFLEKAHVYASSCDERRVGQWDRLRWSDFIRTDRMSEEYRAMLGDGMIRNLAATKSNEASAHSIALVGFATVWSAMGRGNEPGGSVDRVLDGPTSERWLDAWVAYLRGLGVRFVTGASAEAVHLRDGAVESVTVSGQPVSGPVRADGYVFAIPAPRMAALVSDEMVRADAALAGVRRLRSAWMNGLMFYLRRPTPVTPGHVNYVDSAWAITSISQAQFWTKPLSTYGDGQVQECLSTIISDWTTPGTFNGRAARDCTPREIAAETWRQIQAHLNDAGPAVLTDDMLHSWFLDPAIMRSGTPTVDNDEPLFIQSPGSWSDRPSARSAIRNLALAGDWVRTPVNVTTMEGANQGGRAAANAMFDALGSPATRCTITPLFDPPEFQPERALDRLRYQAGLPNQFDLTDPRAPTTT
jgi:uncharacterized protein with NAD-binding domain and iron-sulfur cluster